MIRAYWLSCLQSINSILSTIRFDCTKQSLATGIGFYGYRSTVLTMSRSKPWRPQEAHAY